jgi:hypothetical protein
LIEQIIKTETGLIYTLNSHYYVNKRDTFIKALCQQRIDRGLHGEQTKGPYTEARANDQVLAFLQKQNLPIKDFSDLMQQRIPAEVRERIALAAEVRAYWQVAFKRFVDHICAAMYVHLVMQVADQCFAQLCSDLGVLGGMSTDEAAKLLQPPEAVRQEREDLEASKERLDNAMKVIEDFHRGRFD